MQWRIYYGDGSCYAGSSVEDAVYAPTLNVQVIWIENPKRSEDGGIVCDRDYYLFKDTRWFGCNEAGYYDYLYHYKGPKAIIFGRTLEVEEDYNALVLRAKREKLGV